MRHLAVLADEPHALESVNVRPTNRERPSSYTLRIFLTALWPTVWLTFLLLSLLWRTQNLEAFGLSNDEGAHLMWAKLAVNGAPLYAETRAVQSPLFLESVGWAFQLAGETVQAGRWLTVSGFILLALSLGYLARRHGWLAAVMALMWLSVSPLAFSTSRLVMAEIPATAFAVTSLALLFPYVDAGRRPWLMASGLTFGLSLIMKALHPLLIVPVGLLLMKRHSFKEAISAGLLWLSVAALPLISLLLIYPPAALYEQLILFRGLLRQAIPGSISETVNQLSSFVMTHWGLWLLAAAGVMAWLVRGPACHSERPTGAESPPRGYGVKDASSRRSDSFSMPFSKSGMRPDEVSPHPASPLAGGIEGGRARLESTSPVIKDQNLTFRPLTGLWLAWLLSGLIMLAWHTPLFPHHFIILLPPLILLASDTVQQLAHRIITTPTRPAAYLALPLVIIAALNLPAMVQANQQTAAIVTGGRETQAIELLQAVTQPTDFVMGDSQLLIFMADRQTPPPLGDVALVAIKANLQTAERMIRLSEAYHPSATVQWSLRLPWLPDYLAWVEANYLARRVWDNDHIIYFVPRLPPDFDLPNPQTIHLGPSLVFRGHHVDQTPTALHLNLYWQTTAPLSENYTVFNQLLDSQGRFVAGWDSQPLAGHFPTSDWPSNEIITDVVRLPLPANLPPGEYRLISGMYLLKTGERLVTASGNDYLSLNTITIN